MTIKVDTIRHHNASSDALTFDSSGNTTSGKLTITHDDWDGLRVVNTNTDTYGAYIDLVKDSSSMADGDQAGVIRFRGDDDAGNEHTYGYMLGKCTDVSNGAENGQIEFHTSSGGSIAERLRITQSGNLKILDGDLQINTAGHGIDFSAVSDGSRSVSSNVLTDYEEGTFQPSWSSTGVGLSFTYNSDHRHGFYTKIGNLVTFNLYISSTAAPSGDATNPLYISGLPYSSSNTTANSAALTIGFYYNITAGTDEVFPLAYINKNTSQITLTWSRRNSDANQQMISSDLTDYVWLTVAGSYRV